MTLILVSFILLILLILLILIIILATKTSGYKSRTTISKAMKL